MNTWLEILKAEVAGNSLGSVAAKLGLSRTTISLVCNNKYPGNLDNIRERVESVLLGETVICPILGEIPKHMCKAHQARKAGDVGSTPDAIKLYKACRSGCPHSQLADEELLRRPMRLPVLVEEPDQPAAKYDAEAVLGRLRRQARTDGGDSVNRQNQVFIALLEEELRILGIKYNKALRGR